MKGIHHVVIQNKRMHYEFDLRRNITILKGDSATGKTTLVEMIQEYMDQGQESMVSIQSDKRCGVISGNTWKGQLSEFSDSLIFIDEGNNFVRTDEFARAIQDTDNYYVIVSREGLPNLPYSVDEIYGIHKSGKYGSLKKCYQEFYHIYGEDNTSIIKPSKVITEDSNSGYQFFEAVCRDNDVDCISAGGKSNVATKIAEIVGDNEIIIVADGAAFGSEMDKVSKLIKIKQNVHIYLPESFEWILLASGVVKDSEIVKILIEPSEFIDSQKFVSWERFFTYLLVEKTKDTYLKYNKSTLNKAYLQGQVRKEILDFMKNIEF